MEKTIKQWFEECAEPWAGKALKHAQIEGDENLLVDCLSDAIKYGFKWYRTTEGFSFWENIYDNTADAGK